MDDALIALVLIVISFLSWLFQKGGPVDKMRGRGLRDEGESGEAPPGQDNESASEEERARKFMEALGLPTSSIPARPQAAPPRAENPPPLPRQRTAPAPARTVIRPAVEHQQASQKGNFWDRKESPSDTFSWETSDKTSVSSPKPAGLQKSNLTKAEAEALARIEQAGTEEPWGVRKPRTTRGRAALAGAHARALLADREAARRAIIAQEILGEPRGLQSLPGPATVHAP